MQKTYHFVWSFTLLEQDYYLICRSALCSSVSYVSGNLHFSALLYHTITFFSSFQPVFSFPLPTQEWSQAHSQDDIFLPSTEYTVQLLWRGCLSPNSGRGELKNAQHLSAGWTGSQRHSRVRTLWQAIQACLFLQHNMSTCNVRVFYHRHHLCITEKLSSFSGILCYCSACISPRHHQSPVPPSLYLQVSVCVGKMLFHIILLKRTPPHCASSALLPYLE